MRNFDRSLSLSCKSSKNRSVPTLGLRAVVGGINGLQTKALDSMASEVGSRSVVLGVLEAPNAINALGAFALLHSTWEEMIFVFALISDLDIWLEETVHCRTPSFTKPCCETN